MEISNGVNKKNIPLYIALAIPVLMIVLVSAFIYFPGIGQKPKYNFLYMTGENVAYNYNYGVVYSVVNGRLVKNEVQNPNPAYYPPDTYPNKPSTLQNNAQLYVYDVSANLSKAVSFEEAQALKLDPSSSSPDNYQVSMGNSSSGGMLFGGPSDYSHYYIKGHNRSWQLNLKLSGNYPYSNFQFLGWTE